MGVYVIWFCLAVLIVASIVSLCKPSRYVILKRTYADGSSDYTYRKMRGFIEVDHGISYKTMESVRYWIADDQRKCRKPASVDVITD